ncbi:hypothetical protein AMTRI_Chr04g182120 [Amborella trichopoda]
MATTSDIGVSLSINFPTALAFLNAFAISNCNHLTIGSSPRHSETIVNKFVNFDWKNYVRFLNWMPALFVSITLLAFSVLVPVNWTEATLEHQSLDLTFNKIDKLFVSNIAYGSKRFWIQMTMAYAFTFWACYVLYKEYEIVASMRLLFLASEVRRPDQFMVIVRNVPTDPDESVSEHVEPFFYVNHPNHSLTYQVAYNANKLARIVKKKKSLHNWLDYNQNNCARNPSRRSTREGGFLGLWGESMDSIDFYTIDIDKVISDPKAIMLTPFVSFRTRWAAVVCAQTQQSRNPTLWLTEWAPKPHDVLTIRRLIISVALFFLIFFYIIPITFVQSLANIEGIEKVKGCKVIHSGLSSWASLNIFLIILPTIPMAMSNIEGTAFEQLKMCINQSSDEIAKTIGVSIPMKAAFFKTYILVDDWSGVAAEILRLKHLIMYHLSNTLLVNTEKDREDTLNPRSLGFTSPKPQLHSYFLLDLVYAIVTPIRRSFICLLWPDIYGLPILDLYNQEYESVASFWPDIHGCTIIAMVISQLVLMGLMSTRGAAQSTTILIPRPILTIWFHMGHTELNLNLKAYLQDAYIHLVFNDGNGHHQPKPGFEEESNPHVPTK